MGLTTEIKLGIFVMITSFAFGFLVITFGEIPLFKPKTKSYTVYFNDVGGLSVGAEVRVAGIRAGKVTEINLEKNRVKVKFSVEERFKLYKDASAQIGTLGLMGDRYLAIKPGNPELGELKEGESIISSEEAADTDKLIRELTKTAESFREVAQNLSMLLEENRRNLKKALSNLRELTLVLGEIAKENRESLRSLITQMVYLTENLNRTLPSAIASMERLTDELGDIVAENRSDLRSLISNMRDLSEDLKKELPLMVANLNKLSSQLEEIVSENRQDLRKTLSNLSDITEKLRRSSQRLDNILSTIESGKGTVGKLITDDELYESVTKGAKLFGEAGEVITKTRIYVGFGGEGYSQGDAKGYMSLRIQPEKTTYYLLELVGDSRGRVYTEQIIGGDEIVKKEFKPELTLQIAKNFFIGENSYLTIRAGLKESTGGVGFDLIPHKRVRIYSDLWDTGRKDRPRERDLNPNLQIGIQLRLVGPLYTRFGGDDMLNDKLRGAFLGAGLNFSEDYLKYLLGGLGGLPLP